MFGQAYGAALIIILASVLLGRAICAACGGRQRWWGGPLVGLAGLLVLADAAIKLPGRAVTAIAVCGVALVASAAFLVLRGRPRPALGPGLLSAVGGDVVVGGVALLGGSIPFLAAGRIGPGAGVDNDMAIHLLVAEALRSARMASIWNVLSSGYPTGPHAVVAAVGTVIGAPLIMVFTGLLLAVIVLTALTAAELLAGEALWRRTVIGLLCALTYLVASFYGEGAFKETIMAGLLVGFVLHLEQVRAAWGRSTHGRRFALALPAGVLVAGAIYTYSYLGIAWFAGALVVWLVAELALAPRLAREWVAWPTVASAAPWVLGFLVLGVIVLLPIAGQIGTFFGSLGLSPAANGSFTTSTLGNLYHPLSPYEGLGIWWSADFRQLPVNTFHAGQLSAFALVVVALGAAWALRRRQLVLVGAGVAGGLIWWYSNHSQSPYVAAKALVIGAPVFMALALRGLLARHLVSRRVQALVLAVAAAFCLAAGYSSYRSLQSEPVQAIEPQQELAAFHRITGDSRVLFLGIDDWAPWELRESPVTALSDPTPSVGGAVSPSNKPFGSAALDFDSITPASLNAFPWVITTNSSFASQPPPNFRLVASRTLYELWRRVGATPPSASIEPPGQPGAVLNCRTPAGRQIARQPGVAAVMGAPVAFPGASLGPGGHAWLRLPLPPGRWELSINYVSFVGMRFITDGLSAAMPAYMGRPGSYFNVGAVTGHGPGSPVRLYVGADRPSPLSGSIAYADVLSVAATRLPDARTVVPLRKACGRYVDWYRPT